VGAGAGEGEGAEVSSETVLFLVVR